MGDPKVIDAHYTTKPKRLRLILADRLAIGVAIIIAAVLGTFAHQCQDSVAQHLFGYSPGSCGTLSDIFLPALSIGAAVLLFGRLIDFLITGRFRR